MNTTPKCKCGNPCAHYGQTGGFSKGCQQCNERKAANARKSRAKKKRRLAFYEPL
jgi:hypothetical protein